MADYVLTFRKRDGIEGSESVKPVIHRMGFSSAGG